MLFAPTVTAWPARQALDFLQRSATNHLVFNDPLRPNATYGYTDMVAKTATLLVCSLPYVDASRVASLRRLRHSTGVQVRRRAKYAQEAAEVGGALDITMQDPQGGPL